MNRVIDVVLSLPILDPFRVVAVRVREGVSRVTRAIVVVSADGDLDASPAIGESARLALLEDDRHVRTFDLVLVRSTFLGARGGSPHYELELALPFAKLRWAMTTRRFRDRSVPEIVSSVLEQASIPHEWALSAELGAVPYVVQYRESTLRFVERLLAMEGIFFIAGPGGVLLFSDRSTAVAEPIGTFAFTDGRGALAHDVPAILAIDAVAVAAPRRVTVADRSWKSPSTILRASDGDEASALEVYDFPAGFRDPDAGARAARLRLEALRATARRFEGSSSVMQFSPGRVFALEDPPAPPFEGDFFLVGLEHTLRMGIRGATSYANRFVATPVDVPYRPVFVAMSAELERPLSLEPSTSRTDELRIEEQAAELDVEWEPDDVPVKGGSLSEGRPRIRGVHTATVTGPAGAEIHTDEHGRFKAKFKWEREGDSTGDSRWIRMLQEISTSQFIARVGWEVVVAYIDGDPDRPVGIGRVINGAMPPAYPQPAKKTVTTIKTPSSPKTGGYNELLLDDEAGAMRFDVRAERDLENEVKRHRSETIGNVETRNVGESLRREVERDQSVTVKKWATTECAGEDFLRVGRDRRGEVGSDEIVDIKQWSLGLVTDSDRESVGGSRTTKAGGPEGRGSVTRTVAATLARTVGGNHLAVAKSNLEVQAGLGLAETTFGSRISISLDGDILQSVGGAYRRDVDGYAVRGAKKDAGLSAKKVARAIYGDAVLSSDEEVELRGDSIFIDADGGLFLRSGDATITLQKERLSIAGDTQLIKADDVTARGDVTNLSAQKASGK